MRVTSALWVSAYLRRVTGEGLFAAVIAKGAESAGAIFVLVNSLDQKFSLYGPAPQSFFDTDKPDDRIFILLVENQSQVEIDKKLDSERRFDPDVWIVEVEDRQGRAFLDLAEPE